MTHVITRGDRVIASARSLEKLEEVIVESGIDRRNLRTLRLDVTHGEDEIGRQIDEGYKHWGQIDVLVNNAGTYSLFTKSFQIGYTSKTHLRIQGRVFQDSWKKEGQSPPDSSYLVFESLIRTLFLHRTTLLRRQFETNVFGVLDVATAALPYMRRNPGSCVVVIGSRSAWKAELTVSIVSYQSSFTHTILFTNMSGAW